MIANQTEEPNLAFETRDRHMESAVEVAGKTDVGCVRANNEDNFGYDSRYGIFVVCDGMGGQAAGEVASKMGVDIVLEYFRNELPVPEHTLISSHIPSNKESLANAIQLANKTIFHAGQEQQGRHGMGSTIVAVLVRGNSLTIAHVGDSRIYLVRQGTIQQLTQDHSLVMEQVRLGYITMEQARKSEMQNIILRALGSEEAVAADIEDLAAIPGDILLMTSDGLTRHVQDEEILEIMQRPGDLEHKCGDLVQTAKDRGGEDNITCLLVRIVSRPWYRGILSKLFSGGPLWQDSI